MQLVQYACARHSLTAVGVSVFISVFAAAIGTAADWPTFLNDNARQGWYGAAADAIESAVGVHQSGSSRDGLGRAASEPFEGLEMRHRVNFDNVLHVTVGGNGLAFIGSSVDNKVMCVDTEKGRIRWQFITDGPVRLVPTYAQGSRYSLERTMGSSIVWQLTDGSLIWKLRAGPNDERLLARGRMISRWPIRTGVVIDNDIAYFGAGVLPHEGVYLYAVNTEDGSIVWRNDTISARGCRTQPVVATRLFAVF